MIHFKNEPGFAITIQNEAAPYEVESMNTVRRIDAYGFPSVRTDDETGEERDVPMVSVRCKHGDTFTQFYVNEDTLALLNAAMADVKDEMNS